VSVCGGSGQWYLWPQRLQAVSSVPLRSCVRGGLDGRVAIRGSGALYSSDEPPLNYDASIMKPCGHQQVGTVNILHLHSCPCVTSSEPVLACSPASHAMASCELLCFGATLPKRVLQGPLGSHSLSGSGHINLVTL